IALSFLRLLIRAAEFTVAGRATRTPTLFIVDTTAPPARCTRAAASAGSVWFWNTTMMESEIMGASWATENAASAKKQSTHNQPVIQSMPREMLGYDVMVSPTSDPRFRWSETWVGC